MPTPNAVPFELTTPYQLPISLLLIKVKAGMHRSVL